MGVEWTFKKGDLRRRLTEDVTFQEGGEEVD